MSKRATLRILAEMGFFPGVSYVRVQQPPNQQKPQHEQKEPPQQSETQPLKNITLAKNEEAAPQTKIFEESRSQILPRKIPANELANMERDP